MNETGNVLVSVALGFGLIVAFVSGIGVIGLVAFGLAHARDWLEERRRPREIRPPATCCTASGSRLQSSSAIDCSTAR